MIWLLSALGLVKKAIKAALSIITRYPWQCATALALCAVALLWRANNGLHDDLAACITGRKADRAAYVEAQRVATERATAAKIQTETKYVKIKDRSQIAVTDRLRSELERLRSRASQGFASVGDLPATASAAKGSDGTFAISLVDAEICTANTVKLEGWQRWHDETLTVDLGQ
jgi:hypothetical protein